MVSVPSMKKIRTISITASSPRYFYPLNDSIAYLTELYSAKIYVLNYLRGAVIKEITSVSPWTEHIIPFGDDVLVEERNLDAAPKSTAGFVRINTTTHSVKQRYTFNGSNINGILKDKYHRVWLLLAEDSASMTRPSLICLNSDMSIHRTLLFPSEHHPTLLRINDTGDELYYVDRDVFRLSINAVNLPDTPLILQNNRNIYSMETDPYSGDIYLSDALDYVQPSRISRYNNKGQLLDAFYAGIIAGNFTFRKE